MSEPLEAWRLVWRTLAPLLPTERRRTEGHAEGKAISRDRYERRHRRTAKNVNCVEVMAGASFDGIPSLAEAMGLEGSESPAAPTHTHVGYRRETGYVHGAGLYGHRDYGGKRHALNGTPNTYSGAVYTSLCGKTVVAEHDGERFNVYPADGATVTCKACKRRLAK